MQRIVTTLALSAFLCAGLFTTTAARADHTAKKPTACAKCATKKSGAKTATHSAKKTAACCANGPCCSECPTCCENGTCNTGKCPSGCCNTSVCKPGASCCH